MNRKSPQQDATQQDLRTDSTIREEMAIEAYHPELYQFLLRRLRGTPEAKDLVQDIYLRFLSVPHREKIRQPQRYLYRIAANLVNEYSLRQRRSPVVFDSDQADKAFELESQSQAALRADDPSDKLQSAQRLESLLRRLPPMYRTVLVLWSRDGLTPQQISEQLGLTLLTTRKYLTRAIAEFRSASEKA